MAVPLDHRVQPDFDAGLVYWSEPDAHVGERLTISDERRSPPPEAPCSA